MKMLIIPDVHGRTFWKDAVKGHEEEDIIFLGDYMDPYPSERISVEDAIANFEDILMFKKNHYKNVTLLLGNHDWGYIGTGEVNSSRKSYLYYNDISGMYNLDDFDLVAYRKVNGIDILFSHAGVHYNWLDRVFNFSTWKDCNPEKLADWLNNWLHTGNETCESYLSCYSYFRGCGTSRPYGSCVWADVREWGIEDNSKTNKNLQVYQIFSHTQLELEPIVEKGYACLDVRRYFEITDKGILKDPKHPTCEIEYDLNERR